MKKLNDILLNESKIDLDSLSDSALETAITEADNKEKLDSDGDIGLVLARLSDMISMSDDLYDTASSLEDIDKETEDRVNEVYTALDELYVMFDEKFDIFRSDFDVDDMDIEEELGIKLDDLLKEDDDFITEKIGSDVFKLLKKIGFSQAPTDNQYFKNKKIKPIELYGLEMRSGKWADVWVGQDTNKKFFFTDGEETTIFKSESELAQQLKAMALGESVFQMFFKDELVESNLELNERKDFFKSAGNLWMLKGEKIGFDGPAAMFGKKDPKKPIIGKVEKVTDKQLTVKWDNANPDFQRQYKIIRANEFELFSTDAGLRSLLNLPASADVDYVVSLKDRFREEIENRLKENTIPKTINISAGAQMQEVKYNKKSDIWEPKNRRSLRVTNGGKYEVVDVEDKYRNGPSYIFKANGKTYMINHKEVDSVNESTELDENKYAELGLSTTHTLNMAQTFWYKLGGKAKIDPKKYAKLEAEYLKRGKATLKLDDIGKVTFKNVTHHLTFKDKSQGIFHVSEKPGVPTTIGNFDALGINGRQGNMFHSAIKDRDLDLTFTEQEMKKLKDIIEIKRSSIGGPHSATWITNLEKFKYQLKRSIKDSKGNILPKGTIIYNLPGGVFASHPSLKNKPRYNSQYGMMVQKTPETLQAIEDNSTVLENKLHDDLTFTEKSSKKKVNIKEAKELLGFKLDTPIDLEVEKVSFKFKTSTGKLPSPALQKSLSRYYITFKGFSSSPRQEVAVGEKEAKAFRVDRLKPGKKVRAVIGADVYDRLILKKII